MGYSLTDSSTIETNSNPSQLRLRRPVRVSIWPSRDPIEESGGVNLYGFGPNDPINGYDPDGRFWSLVVTVGFAIADTVEVATGRIDGKEYAVRMAINGAAAAADVLTAGQGGGLGVRAVAVAARAGSAIQKGRAAVRATSVARIGERATRHVSLGVRTIGATAQLGQTALGGYGAVNSTVQVFTQDVCVGDRVFLGVEAFRAGWGLRGLGQFPTRMPWQNVPNPNNFPRGQGYSGVISGSGTVIVSPSRSIPGSNTFTPPGWVPRNLGHARNRTILQNRGEQGPFYGVTVKIDSNGNATLETMSGINPGGRAGTVPESAISTITETLTDAGFPTPTINSR